MKGESSYLLLHLQEEYEGEEKRLMFRHIHSILTDYFKDTMFKQYQWQKMLLGRIKVECWMAMFILL